MQVFIFIFVCLLFFSCFFTLDVYIEPAQSSKIIGPLDENLYIIRNDIPNPFLKTIQRVVSSFRAIPECVDKLTLKWFHDGPHMIRYDIRRIISLDTDKLTVTTDIEHQGFVPRDTSDFTLNFNCDRSNPKATFSEYFYIEIYLLSDTSEVVYGTPISMWLLKKCGICDPTYIKYIPDVSALGITRRPNKCGGCLNGGWCASLPGGYSKCKCKRGYTGTTCELPECKPSCENGGQCIGPQQCSCPPLFKGPMCEHPECKPSCKNGGTCNSTNQCSCLSGFTGSACQISPKVVITTPPTDITVYSMQAVKFRCRASGKPKPKFRWLDSEQRPILPEHRKYKHFKIVVVKSQSYSDLWIYGANQSDQGTYQCIAENQFSMATASAILTVNTNPEGESSLEHLFSGSGDFGDDTESDA